MKIGYVGGGPLWTNSDEIMRAFLSMGHEFVFCYSQSDMYKRLRPEDKKFVHKYHEIKEINEYISDADRVILTPASKKPFKIDTKNPITPIVTGSSFMKNTKKVIGAMKNSNVCPVLSLPSCIDFAPDTFKIYYPPNEYSWISNEKPNDKLRVAFAYPKGHVEKKKGASIVKGAMSRVPKIKGIDVEVDSWKNLKLFPNLERKAKCHVYIDNLNPNLGIGKNTFEAISFGCIVFANTKNETFVLNEFYPEEPPIIHVATETDILDWITKLGSDEELLKKYLDLAKRWKKYISYENTVNYFLHLWETEKQVSWPDDDEKPRTYDKDWAKDTVSRKSKKEKAEKKKKAAEKKKRVKEGDKLDKKLNPVSPFTKTDHKCPKCGEFLWKKMNREGCLVLKCRTKKPRCGYVKKLK